MNKQSPLAALIATGLLTSVSTVLASNVSFSSLPGNNTSFGSAADYLANWDALVLANPIPPAGYGDAHIPTWDYPVPGNISNQGLIAGGSNVDLAFHYQVEFTVDPSEAGLFDFRIAPDFGFGGAVFLNGHNDFNPNDMWWNLDWNNSSQQFLFTENLPAGNYTLDVYGQEGCCDGPTAAQYSTDSGRSWTAFGDNDSLNVVPEVSGLSFLAPGAFILVARRWRRRQTVG